VEPSRVAAIAALTIAGALGQSAPPRPAFDVASIKMYPPGSVVPPGYGGFDRSPDGRITATYMTLRMYLECAYSIEGEVSGPSWTNEERYDIVAQPAEPSPVEQLKLMMQTLLEDRFKLIVRRETKSLPVAVLVIGKSGTKNLPAVEGAGPFSIQRVDGVLRVRNAPMSSIANVLASPFGNIPREKVLDQTGLSGLFDITLSLKDFDPKDFDPRDAAFGGGYPEMRAALLVFVSAALEKQYGLKLERRTVPLESLIVEKGNRVPAGN
jgi:uncharacterized protein (TIGR03435 family)